MKLLKTIPILLLVLPLLFSCGGGAGIDSPTGEMDNEEVLVNISLNYIAVSETTRRRIDNGDCKRFFGNVWARLGTLDGDLEFGHYIDPVRDDNILYVENNTQSSAPIAYSYYQDDMEEAKSETMGKVSFLVPENLLKAGRIQLELIYQLGTHHKDNDFATYDYLCMPLTAKTETLDPKIADRNESQTFLIKTNTEEAESGRDVAFQDFVIPFAFLRGTDDTHFIWMHYTIERQ